MSLFSIITITRDNLDGLKRTYESLKEQTFQGFEWLVIDGDSNDGSIEYLDSISTLHSAPLLTSPLERGGGCEDLRATCSLEEAGWGVEIFWTSEPDKGIYDAMNKGIDRANGFLLLFLNAGDALADKNTLQDVTRYIEELQETPDFIYGDSLEERKGQNPAYKPARPYKKAQQGMFTHHQAMFYRRDILDGLRYDLAYKIAADYKFTLQFLERGKTVLYCPYPLCLFESGGISQQQATLGRDEQFKIRKELAIVPPLKNCFIRLKQKTIWTLRARFPALYWKIKQCTKN